MFRLTGPLSGRFTISGTAEVAGSLEIERTTSLTPPVAWEPVQTNNVTSGSFSLEIPQGTSTVSFFRLRQQSP